MTSRMVAAAAVGALAAIVWIGKAAADGTLPLRLAHHDVLLGGRADRFDYQSIDAQRRLLFIAHLGSGMVTVFDLRRSAVAAQIEGLTGVHGVLVEPGLREVFGTATERDDLDI